MRDPKLLLSILFNSVPRFSEKSLSMQFGFSREEIEEVYKYSVSNALVDRYTVVECPTCGEIDHTFKNITEEQQFKSFECNECGAEFNFPEADTYTYLQFKESKKKVS